MGRSNSGRTSPHLALILGVALTSGHCSGGGGSSPVAPPPAPPPPSLDPARFQVTLGGAADESVAFVAATPTGGVMIAAGTADPLGTGQVDIWLVDANATGIVLRERTWDAAATDPSLAKAVHTPDGGVALAFYEGRVVRLDGSWQEAWTVPDRASAVCALANGDVLLAVPFVDPIAGDRAALVRIDVAGREVWRTETATDMYVTAMAEGLDGTIDVAGSHAFARLASNGTPLWSSHVPYVDESNQEETIAILPVADGWLFAVGYGGHYNGRQFSSVPRFVALDPAGTPRVNRYLSGSEAGSAFGILSGPGATLDLLTGAGILRVDGQGELQQRFVTPPNTAAFDRAPDGGFWVVSTTEDFGRGGEDVLLGKLDSSGASGPPPVESPLTPATTFGDVRSVADLGERSAPLSLAATSDASSPPLVAWFPYPDYDYDQPLDSARASRDGHWDVVPVAPAGRGGLIQGLTAAGSGRAFAVWGDLDVSDFDPKRGWNTTVTRLAPRVDFVTSPEFAGIAANARGQAVAVWQQRALGNGLIAARRYDPATGVWNEPTALPAPATSGNLGARVALADDGRALVVRAGTYDLSSLVGPPDGSWQNLGSFVEGSDLLFVVDLVSNGGSDVLVLWNVFGSAANGLHGMWLRDGAPAGSAVTLAPPNQEGVRGVMDSDGRTLVAWVEGVKLVSREGAPGAAWSERLVHPDPEADGAELGGLASLGHGEFLASWFERRGRHGTAWASRYDAHGAWHPAEFLGDALGGYVTQAGPTVIWLAPTNPGTALMARKAN